MTNSFGAEIIWKRDWNDVYRIFSFPFEKETQCNIALTYICNQPSTNSIGVDSYGYHNFGVINWNTILLYPEGIPINKIKIQLTLTLPIGWSFGSALQVASSVGNKIVFEEITLEQLIDMPLICGENFETFEIAETKMAKYYLHLVAEDERDLIVDDSIMNFYHRLVLEAEELFGRTHFDEYHLLLVLSDNMPGTGLEHRNSSLNGVKAHDMRLSKFAKSRVRYLIAHEFAHAWCGKYRRPAGMYTDDFQKNKDTDFLWVYEGLDQYLGNVLAVRSGFLDPDRYKEGMARRAGSMTAQTGRQWRPLRDTEVSSHILRGGSKSWKFLRRNQEYYNEGAMIWLEIDARIRQATKGKKSLDDFCAKFFSAGETDAEAVPFDLNEIVETLNSISQRST